MNDRLARLTSINTQLACQQVAVTDNATLQRAVGLAYAGTAVRHRAGCQCVALQKIKCREPCFVFANARVIKNTQVWPCCQRILRRTDAAVRAADRNATSVMRPKLGDGVNQLEGPHALPDLVCLNQSA